MTKREAAIITVHTGSIVCDPTIIKDELSNYIDELLSSENELIPWVTSIYDLLVDRSRQDFIDLRIEGREAAIIMGYTNSIVGDPERCVEYISDFLGRPIIDTELLYDRVWQELMYKAKQEIKTIEII